MMDAVSLQPNVLFSINHLPATSLTTEPNECRLLTLCNTRGLETAGIGKPISRVKQSRDTAPKTVGRMCEFGAIFSVWSFTE